MSCGPQPAAVTIVSGLPRSGTSMMMQMIEAGGIPALTDGKRGPDPHNPRGYLEFESVKALPDDASWMEAARGRVVKVISTLLPRVPPGFPYRVVFMTRDLDEVLDSQATLLGETEGTTDLARERLTQALSLQLGEVRAWLAAQPEIESLAVAYRDAVSAPRACAARVAAFLGEGLDIGAMAAAVDPSLSRHQRRH